RERDQWNWQLGENWLPRFAHRANPEWNGAIFAPVGQRFMVYRAPRTPGAQSFTFSVGDIYQTANIRHKLPGVRLVASEFNWGYQPGFVISIYAGTLLASIALRCPGPARFESEGGDRSPLRVRIHCDGEPTLFVGIGLSAVGAYSATLEAHRVPHETWQQETEDWLAARAISVKDAELERKANRNAHFARFFAMGRALDTDEVVSMTSRSYRYYVSSAYWDRDSLLWLYPFLVRNDKAHAEQLLRFAFGRQLNATGIHSRYITGRILEFGFELDELLAPLVALGQWNALYPKARIWEDDLFRRGVDALMTRFTTWRHKKHALYSTELMPTDDLVLEGRSYLTYNNALAIYALKLCQPIFRRIAPKWAKFAASESAAIRGAVKKHLVKNGMFQWAGDLAGDLEFYDEAAGSLVLLPYLGFCKPSDPVYGKTLKHLYSKDYPYYRSGPFAELGNRHTDSPHPWVLSACSSVVSGVRVKEGLDFLRRAPMDDGIACESVDINTGVPTSGLHFGTCAGYVAYAIMAGAAKARTRPGSSA
ncbi:MAG TPA: glycoside hydrolase family 125 protein, partial [Kiritimatiellia bacterium]